MIICVSGEIGSGKTTLANRIASEIGCRRVGFGDILRNWCVKKYGRSDRQVLQEEGAKLIALSEKEYIDFFERESGGNWADYNFLVLDGIRHPKILSEVKNRFGETYLIYCDCESETKTERIHSRNLSGDSDPEILNHPIEQEIVLLKDLADCVLSDSLDTESVYNAIKPLNEKFKKDFCKPLSSLAISPRGLESNFKNREKGVGELMRDFEDLSVI